MKYTLEEFGEYVKTKHPDYSDLENTDLATRVLDKYPEYQDMIISETETVDVQQKPSLISNIGKALSMGATPPLMGMGAAMRGEGQVDPLTQAIPKTREEQGRLLKGVQTGLGFTPISPLSEFVGETSTALIDGKTVKEALGAGATAAGTDLALRVVMGGLPAGARKVLSPEYANKLDQGFARPIGKKLFGSSFTKRFRQEVVDEIVDRPELLTGTKRTVDDIGKELSEATKNYEMDTGKLIGEAKKNMNMKNVSVKVDDISDDLFENSRKIATTDEAGKDALDIINKEINKLNKKGNIYDVKKSATLEDGLDSLKEIDDSTILQKIYTKNLKAESLSSGESLALRTRGALNERLMKTADPLFEGLGEGLSDLKKKYRVLKVMKKDPTIKTAFNSADAMTAKIMQITRESKREAYDGLRELTAILGKKDILDDVIKISVQDELDLIKATAGGAFPIIQKLMFGHMPASLIKSGNFTPGNYMKPLIGGSVRTAASPKGREWYGDQ